MPYRLVSLFSIFALIGIAWLISDNHRLVDRRIIGLGLLIQTAVAAFLFMFPPGVTLFMWLNDAAGAVMDSASAGARFVFGPLALIAAIPACLMTACIAGVFYREGSVLFG